MSNTPYEAYRQELAGAPGVGVGRSPGGGLGGCGTPRGACGGGAVADVGRASRGRTRQVFDLPGGSSGVVVAVATACPVHGVQRIGLRLTPTGAVCAVAPDRGQVVTTAIQVGQPSRAGVPFPRPRPRVDEVTLAAVNTAMSSVYCFLHITMQDWGLLDLLSDAKRVAVELVAHAVEQTGIPDAEPHWTEITRLPTIGVRVIAANGVALIQVRDCDYASPFPNQGVYLNRHLELVRELRSAWNWYPLDGGRVIWAEVTPRHAQLRASLPDPNLLQAVLDSLHRLDTGWGHRGEL